jgi:hypothetical protein
MFHKFSSYYVDTLKQIVFLKKLKNQQRLNSILAKTANVAAAGPSLWKKIKNITYNYGLDLTNLGLSGLLLYQILSLPKTTVQVPLEVITRLDKEQQDKLNSLLSSKSLSTRQKQEFVNNLTNKVYNHPLNSQKYNQP